MKILVTGGAGYIGSALVEKLNKLDQVKEIIIYDNLSRNNETVFFGKYASPENIHLVRADILDSRKLRQQLKNVDIVFHLAAKVITPFANQDPHFFEQINHWGTAEIVYAAEESEVKHFVYLSSTSVYDRSDKEITENSIPNPHSYYGISKLRGEEHVHRLTKKIRTQIIRCGNVYGINRGIRFDAVINNFMLQANFENKVSIHGSGLQKRSFIHVNNIAETLSQLVQKDIPSGVYNHTLMNLSVNEIADVIEQIYPGLERIFINQHLQLGSLEVSTESQLNSYITIYNKTLLEELSEFKTQFAFSSSKH